MINEFSTVNFQRLYFLNKMLTMYNHQIVDFPVF